MTTIRTFRSEIGVSAEELFRWHEQPPAFARYNSPWDPVKIVRRKNGPGGSIADGAEIELSVSALGPIRLRWLIGHRNFERPRLFEDYQIRGPFRSWRHRHVIEAAGSDKSILKDEIEFEVPPAAKLLGPAVESIIGGKLDKLFAYRHFIVSGDLAQYRKFDRQSLTILISGGSGLVGTALRDFLGCLGHRVINLVRRVPRSADEILWNPARGECNLSTAGPIDAVINLSGENVFGVWTAGKKEKILNSRLDSTRTLVSAIKQLDRKPAVFVSSSAIGIYGPQTNGPCDESASLGAGFLADVCKAWENEAKKAEEFSIRTVIVRTGLVLTASGGMLKAMSPPFKMGLGGPIGSGRQIQSWVAIDDLISIFYHAIQNRDVAGPVNGVAPYPVSNRILTEELAAVLHRPAILPVPEFAVSLLPGNFAAETVLSSVEVAPKKLLDTGYIFRSPKLDETLKLYLGR